MVYRFHGITVDGDDFIGFLGQGGFADIYLIHMSLIKRNGYAGGCGLLIPDAADKAALTGLDQFFLLLIGELADQGIHASAVMAVQMTVGIQETRLTCGKHGRWLGK